MWKFLVLFSVILCSIGSHAVLANEFESPPHFEKFEVLHDNQANLSLTDILTKHDWQSISIPIFSGGYTTGAHWIKLTFHSNVNEHLLLTLLFAAHSDVRLYLPQTLVDKTAHIIAQPSEVKEWFFLQQGNLFPFNQRELDWRAFSFALRTINTSEQTVYLRIVSSSSHLVFPQIWRINDFLKYEKHEMMLFSYVMGIMTLILLLALLAWYLTRKPLQRHYVMLTLAAFFYFLCTDGILAQWSIFNPYINSVSVGVASALLQMMLLFVMRDLVFKKENTLRLYHVQSAFIGVGMLTAIFAILGYYYLIATFFVSTNLIATLVSSAWGIWLWRKKILAGYICLVYCLILASYLIPSVGFLGLSTLPFFNLYGVELGTFLTLLILLVITIYDAYQKVILHQKATVEAQLQAKASQSQRYWLTMLTHEIKTPLAIIQSSCQNIVLFDIDIPIQKRIDKIQRSALRIDTLVQRFLRNDEILSRLDHIQLTRIHLSKWLPEQLALFDESAQKRWHVKIQSELVILADENLLAIALNNLLINALKYSDEKHAIDINVQIHMRQRVEGILFSITDHSSQIDDEKRDYLFGRYQLSEYAGNGIGLWACREIARAHSGEVWLEKTSHFTGNTFTIWLPKKDEN
ncbi:MAG: hypothetical protein RL755_1437 [Pseudomonadota bacterium]